MKKKVEKYFKVFCGWKERTQHTGHHLSTVLCVCSRACHDVRDTDGLDQTTTHTNKEDKKKRRSKNLSLLFSLCVCLLYKKLSFEIFPTPPLLLLLLLLLQSTWVKCVNA